MRRLSRGVLGGVVLAGALVVGGYVALAQDTTEEGRIALPCAESGECPTSYGDIPSWPVNENGQSYGVQGDSPVPPDLISVVATNGLTGYSRSQDLVHPTFSSPEEALAWQEENAGKGWTVPVFEQDGETLIGEFTIGRQ
jgi:hypothetical protein